MAILRQVGSRGIKYDFSIKISLQPDLGCAPCGGFRVPASEEVLSIPGGVSSKLFIPLPFKDQLPALKALLQTAAPDTCPSNIFTFVRQENLILVFC